jgi:ribosomal protein L18E
MRDLLRSNEVAVTQVASASINLSKPRMATKKDLTFIAVAKDIAEKEKTVDLRYNALYFTRSAEMLRVLSGPEIFFLMLIIEKTNYGTLK